MRKVKVLGIAFSFALILNLSYFLFFHKNTPKINKITGVEDPTYFIEVPIVKYSSIQSPCVLVDIEDEPVSFEIDLGYRGIASVYSQILDRITDKSFLKRHTYFGAKGNQYTSDIYTVPKIQIGDMAFISPLLKEENEQFIKDALFNDSGDEAEEPGRIGWELFGNVNFFMDVKNSKIAFCDSIETLKKNGYFLDGFTETPLFIERGFLEIEAKLSTGSLRCMLDTGSTCNLLNKEDLTWDEAVENLNNKIEISNFQIAERDFGPISFGCLPIKFPIHIEAILGMEFLKNQVIFIDFSKEKVYFEITKTSPVSNTPDP